MKKTLDVMNLMLAGWILYDYLDINKISAKCLPYLCSDIGSNMHACFWTSFKMTQNRCNYRKTWWSHYLGFWGYFIHRWQKVQCNSQKNLLCVICINWGTTIETSRKNHKRCSIIEQQRTYPNCRYCTSW